MSQQMGPYDIARIDLGTFGVSWFRVSETPRVIWCSHPTEIGCSSR
jgi:hypothetical protein